MMLNRGETVVLERIGRVWEHQTRCHTDPSDPILDSRSSEYMVIVDNAGGTT